MFSISDRMSDFFCLMPDHIHLLWTGVAKASNQLVAMRRLRTDLNAALMETGYELQRQAYDHVLKPEERQAEAIEDLMEYIARNPERKGIVGRDGFDKYQFTGCLLPGAYRVELFQDCGWLAVWRTISFLRRTECFRRNDPKYE